MATIRVFPSKNQGNFFNLPNRVEEVSPLTPLVACLKMCDLHVKSDHACVNACLGKNAQISRKMRET